MSKTLTEQWREGTIEYGLYYVRVVGRNDITIAHKIEEDLNVKEVLAPVPDYNQFVELIEKTEMLEKKLEIATKALEFYTLEDAYVSCYGNPVNPNPMVARKALKEMEGVR